MDFEPEIWDVGYLIASILFILGLKKLGHPRTAPTGRPSGVCIDGIAKYALNSSYVPSIR